MRILILICTSICFLKLVLAKSDSGICGNDAYWGPLGSCESCGKLCDTPSLYPDSCKRLCPRYVAKDHPVISSLSSSSLRKSQEHCGNQTYLGPTGSCESCGKLCDKPVVYPVSCQRLCPHYIAADRLDSVTKSPSLWKSSLSWILASCFSFGVLIIIVSLCCKLWGNFLKPYFRRQAEQRARKNLRHPTQVENNITGCDVRVPLTSPLDDDAVNVDNTGDFEGEVLTSSESNFNQNITEGNSSGGSYSLESVVTIDDDTGNDSSLNESFDFGATFPFHSLCSLKDLF